MRIERHEYPMWDFVQRLRDHEVNKEGEWQQWTGLRKLTDKEVIKQFGESIHRLEYLDLNTKLTTSCRNRNCSRVERPSSFGSCPDLREDIMAPVSGQGILDAPCYDLSSDDDSSSISGSIEFLGFSDLEEYDAIDSENDVELTMLFSGPGNEEIGFADYDNHEDAVSTNSFDLLEDCEVNADNNGILVTPSSGQSDENIVEFKQAKPLSALENAANELSDSCDDTELLTNPRKDSFTTDDLEYELSEETAPSTAVIDDPDPGSVKDIIEKCSILVESIKKLRNKVENDIGLSQEMLGDEQIREVRDDYRAFLIIDHLYNELVNEGDTPKGAAQDKSGTAASQASDEKVGTTTGQASLLQKGSTNNLNNVTRSYKPKAVSLYYPVKRPLESDNVDAVPPGINRRVTAKKNVVDRRLDNFAKSQVEAISGSAYANKGNGEGRPKSNPQTLNQMRASKAPFEFMNDGVREGWVSFNDASGSSVFMSARELFV